MNNTNTDHLIENQQSIINQPGTDMPNSRLQKNLQKKSMKNILFAIGGVIILLVTLFTLGPQLLILFSTLTTHQPDKQQASNTSAERTYLAPPIIDPMTTATNSAQVTINGHAEPKEIVHLYVNGDFVDKMTTKTDKRFSFKNVKLEKGDNIIKAKTVIDKNESAFSRSFTILYSEKDPILELESPQDGQTFKKDQSPIKITGKTDPGSKVTINTFWAIVDSEGKFSYQLPLKDGENSIKIEVTNEVGNNITKEIKIKTE